MSITSIPSEILHKILSFLPLSDYRTVGAVSKLWNSLIKQLADQNIKIFGVQEWKEFYNLDVEGAIPVLPTNSLEILQSERLSFAEKNGTIPKISIILVPKELNLDKLEKLLENPNNKKNIGKIQSLFSRDIVNRFGDKPIENTYWVAITDTIIDGSQGLSVIAQKELISNKTKCNWEMIKLVEAVISCFMNYSSSRQHLFGSSPLVYTNTQDSIDQYSLAAGNFEQGTLSINNRFGNYPCYGAAARREFSPKK